MSQRKEARPPRSLRRRTKHDLPDEIVLEILARLPVKSLLRFRKFAIMDVYLWNPSIRKFKRLPDTCLTQLRTVRLGFGYDSQNNDYKVVRISWTRAKPMPPPEVQVYSLSSDSWKRVELGLSCRPKFNFTMTFPFVSGRLHWMIRKIEGGGGQERRFTDMILSLDVNSEKFKELPLPGEGKCTKKGLASFKGKLALIKYGSGVQPCSSLCSIYVITEYGVLDSWNKLCVLPIENPSDFIGTFINYGLLLVQKWARLVSTNSELGRNYKSVLIDPETLHEKEISNQVDFRLDVAAYMECLALLDGAHVVSY